MSRQLLLIGTSRELHPKIKTLGHRMSLLCPVKNLKTLPNPGLYDRIVGMAAGATTEDWIAQAKLMHAQGKFDAIGGFNEVTQHFAAEIAKALGLPYHDAAVIRLTRMKDEMRRRLREAGLDETPSRLVKTAADIAAFAAEAGFPVVLKPVDGRGSLGVSIVKTKDDIPNAVAWFSKWASDHQMLAEKFLQGDEWSVEAFSERGKHKVVCVTQKFKDPVTSVETGHCLPAPLPEATRAAIEKFVTGMLTAIGIENGPSHTEVFTTPDGPRIVETHARLAGDSIVELVQLASGVDLDELWIRQVAGESVFDKVPARLDRWASIRFATPQAVGTLERVDGVADASGGAGVVRVTLLQDPGAEVQGAYDSFSRGAYAIAQTGASAEEATNRAKDAAGKLRFVVACPG